MRKKKQAEGMSQADYDRMCERMIALANRGRNQTELVKSIAKAGNVKPVLDYVDKFKKLFVKFTAQDGGRSRGGSKD